MTIKNYDEKKSSRHPGEKTTKALEEQEILKNNAFQQGANAWIGLRAESKFI